MKQEQRIPRPIMCQQNQNISCKERNNVGYEMYTIQNNL